MGVPTRVSPPALHTYHFVDTLTEQENQVDEFSYFFANGAPIKKEDYQNILRDNDEIWALDVDPSLFVFLLTLSQLLDDLYSMQTFVHHTFHLFSLLLFI